MASKILAGLLAAAVLTVGGYTYWNYGGHCCGTTSQPTQSTGCPSDTETSPCCQEPSRTSCVGLPPGESCCEDVSSPAAPEVLVIPPREVK